MFEIFVFAVCTLFALFAGISVWGLLTSELDPDPDEERALLKNCGLTDEKIEETMKL